MYEKLYLVRVTLNNGKSFLHFVSGADPELLDQVQKHAELTRLTEKVRALYSDYPIVVSIPISISDGYRYEI